METPPFIVKQKVRGKRAEGRRYERKVQEHFLATIPEYVPSPWIKYQSTNRSRWQWCQPDGLIVDIKRGRIVVVEVKLKHTSDAWWQVRRLYTPVVSHLFGAEWQVEALEVVRWFDPFTAFPEQIEMCENPRGHWNGRFRVHIWKP